MIDVDYPAVVVELGIDDPVGIQLGDTPAAPLSMAAVAHHVVRQTLSAGDVARAGRAARFACQLPPEDETSAVDLARVLDAQGQVEAARAVLRSAAAARDRPRSRPGSDWEG